MISSKLYKKLICLRLCAWVCRGQGCAKTDFKKRNSGIHFKRRKAKCQEKRKYVENDRKKFVECRFFRILWFFERSMRIFSEMRICGFLWSFDDFKNFLYFLVVLNIYIKLSNYVEIFL